VAGSGGAIENGSANKFFIVTASTLQTLFYSQQLKHFFRWIDERLVFSRRRSTTIATLR
jgi:hypothetical protein